MLRITKSTPGVLDLSAVKDEHGLPVTLIGPSYRDVPDHEESNPVLQRIVELGWVTVKPVPLEVNETTNDVDVENSVPSIEQPPTLLDAPIADDAENSTHSAESQPTNHVTQHGVPDGQDVVPNTNVEPVQDGPARSDDSAKTSGKSDTRKAGRRA